MTTFAGKTHFTIHENDAGSEAYTDQYVKWLEDQIRYWSYCMDIGMREACPEKVEELADFLIFLRIAPYHIRNNSLETVRTTRPDPCEREHDAPAGRSTKY